MDHKTFEGFQRATRPIAHEDDADPKDTDRQCASLPVRRFFVGAEKFTINDDSKQRPIAGHAPALRVWQGDKTVAFASS